MLFDLRSRGRRTTVRVVYLFLALLMVGGLVLVGVGTGNNNGGLLNAFTGSGSGNGEGAVAAQQTSAAIKQIKRHPNSPSAWGLMVQARWNAAAAVSGGASSTTGTVVFNNAGKAQLELAAQAWQKYLKLTSQQPSLSTATIAAGVFGGLARWSQASQAWQYVIAAAPPTSPVRLKGYLCTALTAYAAGRSQTADLAAAKAQTLSTKAERAQLKTLFTQAKASQTAAAQTITSSGSC